MFSKFLPLALAVSATAGCMTIVRPGEVSVRDLFGDQSSGIGESGLKVFLWPIFDITKVSVRLTNLKLQLQLPSKEGLTIASEISILYSIEASRVPTILREIGGEYEERFVLPVFRSAVADVAARFPAKDMHSGKRSEIEEEVRKAMNLRINGRGFQIEAVLLKTIQLPEGLSASIEARMRAEQEAQQMEFVIQRERQEADRKVIEAEGVRNANLKLSEGLTPTVLRYKAIEALAKLAASPNAKLVVTNGADPFAMASVQAMETALPKAHPAVLEPPRR